MNGEFPNTSGKSPADSETTFVWSESTAHVTVVGVEADWVANTDLSALSTSGDGSSNTDLVASTDTEGEDNTEVLVALSVNGDTSGGGKVVLTSGGDTELPLSVSKVDTVVSGGDGESGWVAVLVGWVSGPSVFQKAVNAVQLWVLEVKSNSHDDGERSVQGVVIVEVIVDKWLDIV